MQDWMRNHFSLGWRAFSPNIEQNLKIKLALEILRKAWQGESETLVACRLWIVLFLVLWRDCIVLADNWSNNPGHSGIALSGAPSITGFQLYSVLYRILLSHNICTVPYYTQTHTIPYHTVPYQTKPYYTQSQTHYRSTAYCSQYKPIQDQRSHVVDVYILGFVFQRCFIRESIIQTQALAAKSINSEIPTGSLML